MTGTGPNIAGISVQVEPIAPSSYVGVAGYFITGGCLPNDGLFFDESDLRIGQIADGTSNTFALGERRYEGYCRGSLWVATPNVRSVNFGGGIGAGVGFVSMPYNQCTDSFAQSGFSSAHPGGSNFAMIDGSVQFVTDSIDFGLDPDVDPTQNFDTAYAGSVDGQYNPDLLGVFQLLGIRNDGSPVGTSSF